jgi:hypothetical protein
MTRGLAPARAAPRAGAPEPTPRAARPGVSARRPAGCVCRSERLVKAFEALSACNFRRGLLDYQCAAWKALGQELSRQEQENRARVQVTLLELMDHADDRVRLAVARSLASYARQRAVERRLALRFRKEPSGPVRAWILFALQGQLPTARALLAQALRGDPVERVRARAAQRAGTATFIADPGVRTALLDALVKDKAAVVRRRAAESLGHARGAPEVEKALLACLPDEVVGPHCALGLARLGSAKGLAAVLRLLRAGLSRHAVAPLYLLAVGQFPVDGARAARLVGLLQQVARDPRMRRAARQYALGALGHLGARVRAVQPQVVQILSAASRDGVLGRSARIALESLKKRVKGASAAHERNPRPR